MRGIKSLLARKQEDGNYKLLDTSNAIFTKAEAEEIVNNGLPGGVYPFFDEHDNICIDFRIGPVTDEDVAIHKIVEKIGLSSAFYQLCSFISKKTLNKWIEYEFDKNDIEYINE